MDEIFVDREFVNGESSEQTTPNSSPIPPAPAPASPDLELLGWQPNSSFMANLFATNEQLHHLPAVQPQPWQLTYPRWKFQMPELPPPTGPLHLEQAAAGNQMRFHAADQAPRNRMDDKGKKPLLDELVFPPLLSMADIEPETCMVRKKVKQMSFEAWADETGVTMKMPNVTATGDGTYGKKIEGFIYKFGEAEVGLMCFCHGSFLSPDEFIKHAGGNAVTEPLKQIEICFSS